jgi:hypothetical protein
VTATADGILKSPATERLGMARLGKFVGTEEFKEFEEKDFNFQEFKTAAQEIKADFDKVEMDQQSIESNLQSAKPEVKIDSGHNISSSDLDAIIDKIDSVRNYSADGKKAINDFVATTRDQINADLTSAVVSGNAIYNEFLSYVTGKWQKVFIALPMKTEDDYRHQSGGGRQSGFERS